MNLNDAFKTWPVRYAPPRSLAMSGYKSPAHQRPDPRPSADISTVVFDGIGPGLSTEPGGQKTMHTHRATLFPFLHVHGEHLHSTCIRASSGEVSTDTWSVF